MLKLIHLTMLITEPAATIVGGCWHTDGEFDEQLVTIISNFVVQQLGTDKKGMTVSTITKKVADSHLSTIELSEE